MMENKNIYPSTTMRVAILNEDGSVCEELARIRTFKSKYYGNLCENNVECCAYFDNLASSKENPEYYCNLFLTSLAVSPYDEKEDTNYVCRCNKCLRTIEKRQ